MQLTNYSFLDSRSNYLSSLTNKKASIARISTGDRLDRSGTDVGALGQKIRARQEILQDNATRTSLQNARSYLYAQEIGLKKVLDVYERMEILATKALDPTLSEAPVKPDWEGTTALNQQGDFSDRESLNVEFQDLIGHLDKLMQSEFQGKPLFSSTLLCGGVKNIPIEELDLVGGKPAGVSHAVRAQTVDAGSPAGTISFRVNSGGAGDTYRVWMGDIEVFSAGNRFTGPDHTQQYDDPGGFSYPGNGWKTSNSAGNGDDDLIEVTFAPGEKTTYKITPGRSNDPDNDGVQNENTSNGTDHLGNVLYQNIFTKDLPQSFDRKDLTLQLETTSIGIIYTENGSSNSGETIDPATGKPIDNIAETGIKFTPKDYKTPVSVDHHGNSMDFDAKGFGTLDSINENTTTIARDSGWITGTQSLDESIAQAFRAQDVLDHLRGNGDYFGEIKCVLEERLGSIGAEYRRIDLEIEDLENQIVNGEQMAGRISDTNYASEATQMAKDSIKMGLATQVMSNVTRLTDVLIPLTTNHFRGAGLSATL